MKLHILIISLLTILIFTGCGQKYSSYKTNKILQKKSLYKKSGLKHMKRVGFKNVPNWREQNFKLSLKIFKKSCEKNIDDDFRDVCRASRRYNSSNAEEFFEKYFQPFKLTDRSGDEYGRITGYYKITLRGSLFKSKRFKYPVYQTPKNRYFRRYSRKAINETKAPIAKVICYVENRYELYHLHLQGSGRIILQEGGYIDVNYMNSNHHKFRGITEALKREVKKVYGVFTPKLSEKWVRSHKYKADKIFNRNARYIFFTKVRHLNATGSIGMELIPNYSIAVDKKYVPIGAPVMLYSYQKNRKERIKKLVFAHDVGAAINGKIRADYYYGVGDKARAKAMQLNDLGNMIVLLPKHKVSKVYQKSFIKRVNTTLDILEKPIL